ncbi:MAG: trypsin-like peptidase domain-containing protein [Oscillospiraceae bacterium]|nr:trypsin-like peptidase domain-containing protein [Oscillospiraceae bacterium]
MIKTSLKRTLTFFIACALLALLPFRALAAQPGFDHFVPADGFAAGQFHDVNADRWYAPYLCDAVSFGLILGRSEHTFDPYGLLTMGETVVLAARLSRIYHTGQADFDASVPFYTVYVQYALSRGIIDAPGNFSAPVTRTEFAGIMHNALPDYTFTTINDIPDFGIRDVASDTPGGAAVYALYRAGILAGSDRFGSFLGGTHISRAEAAAILVRLAHPAVRLDISLPTAIPVEALFAQSTASVFMIETFDAQGRSIRTGSGFFIASDGLAATALHVVQGAANAHVVLFCGEILEVAGIRAVNADFNLALIEVRSETNNRSYLTLADSNLLETGNRIFAIGSPRNLINSISAGIVAHTSRELAEENMIQFTAPISFGSGGGPVLNILGQVVGVASSSFTYGQNINLAIPVNLIKELELGDLITMERFYEMMFEIDF